MIVQNKIGKQLFVIALLLSIFVSGSIYSQQHSFKVITITMFEMGEISGDVAGEAQLWYERDSLLYEIDMPGAHSPLYHNNKGQGLIITGIGVSNAAASIMALGLNPDIDLKKTYFIVAGIGGTSPNVSTIGSAVWSEWIVSADLCHSIDGRELPKGWDYSLFRLGCASPWCESDWISGSEIFQLNSKLTHLAYSLSKDVELFDNKDVQNIRNSFHASTVAYQKPSVIIGGNLAGNTFFFGKKASDWADWWIKKWTHEKATYCISNMEDTGTLLALKRLADASIISYDRIVVLRTVSDFDQQLPGKTTTESLNKIWLGFPVAIENAYRVGSIVANEITNNWEKWETNIPD